MKINKDPHLQGIITNDPQVLREIYRLYLPGIIAHIKKHKGNAEEAKDVFQDAILVVYEKVKSPDFELREGLGNYIFGICRFLWLRELKKKQREPITITEDIAHVDARDWASIQQEEERQALFKQNFARLGEDCQKVLQLFFDGERLKTIAEKLGYTDSYIKLKKFQCKERLTKWIKTDRRYKELRES